VKLATLFVPSGLFVLAAAAAPQDPPRQSGDPPTQKGAKPMPVPRAVAFRREKPIEVDGSLIDWPELPALDLGDQRQLSGTSNGAWRGPDDLSAFAFLQWDDDSLWFACSVKDEWHRSLDADTLRLSEIPAADNVVLTFDPARDTRAIGPDPGRRDDREFWLADEPSRVLVLWDRLRGSADVVPAEEGRCAVGHDKELGITTYEARIPWARILATGTPAGVGLCFDLQVVVNDFDEATDSMAQTRIGWTFGCDSIIRPGLLGSVMLVADMGALSGRMPEFPAHPATVPEPVPGPAWWQDFARRLAQRPPAVHDGSKAPEEAGGSERFKLLEELEDQLERFPRVDFVDYCCRIQRRMLREVAGATATGLPWYWLASLKQVAATASGEVAGDRLRLFRLPMGGWLARAPESGFVVDGAGADLQEIWGAAGFAVVTQPLDLTRRNDPLLLRMTANQPPRRFLTHAAFHLPLVNMADMALVEPGKEYDQPHGIRIRTLGKQQPDGTVPYSLPYWIATPGGVSVLIAGPSTLPQDVAGHRADAMVLSPRNPHAVAVAAAADCDLVILDDQFLCQSLPHLPRVALRDLFAVQKAIQPRPSILLGPGEAWEIEARRR
jgi:hypothetical protein